jgi:hypothetical protein
MPQVGFEPTIPVFELMKTAHVLDYTATVLSPRGHYVEKKGRKQGVKEIYIANVQEILLI